MCVCVYVNVASVSSHRQGEDTLLQSDSLSKRRNAAYLSCCLLSSTRWDLSSRAMDFTKRVGRCFGFFVLAIVLDVAGLVLFLLGIFAQLSFWDFFVLSGPIIIFLSLLFWIFWYLGNINVPYQQLLSWRKGMEEWSGGERGIGDSRVYEQRGEIKYFGGPVKCTLWFSTEVSSRWIHYCFQIWKCLYLGPVPSGVASFILRMWKL